jgi:hypothetical protein
MEPGIGGGKILLKPNDGSDSDDQGGIYSCSQGRMGDDWKEMGGRDIDDEVNYRRMLGSGGEEIETESYVLYVQIWVWVASAT